MVVSFIITKDKKIIFGTKPFEEERHHAIADAHGIAIKNIAGGGLADLDAKVIFGESSDFGPYNAHEMQELLPSWKIEEVGRGRS